MGRGTDTHWPSAKYNGDEGPGTPKYDGSVPPVPYDADDADQPSPNCPMYRPQGVPQALTPNFYGKDVPEYDMAYTGDEDSPSKLGRECRGVKEDPYADFTPVSGGSGPEKFGWQGDEK